MQQSSVIFAYLFAAYFLFITLRGELPTYITLLRGGGQSATPGAAGDAGGNPIAAGAQQLLNNDLFSSPPPPAGATDWLSQLTGG